MFPRLREIRVVSMAIAMFIQDHRRATLKNCDAMNRVICRESDVSQIEVISESISKTRLLVCLRTLVFVSLFVDS